MRPLDFFDAAFQVIQKRSSIIVSAPVIQDAKREDLLTGTTALYGHPESPFIYISPSSYSASSTSTMQLSYNSIADTLLYDQI